MRVDRRSFILGSAAVVATLATPAVAKFSGHTAHGILDPRLPFRRIKDILFSNMATGAELRDNFAEDPVMFTLYRNDVAVLHWGLNPRATLRWAAVPGSEIWVRKQDALRFDVEPCHTHCELQMISDITEHDTEIVGGRQTLVKPRCFSECYSWKDGKAVMSSICALSMEDESVLADSDE